MEMRGTREWMRKGQSGRLTGILEREAFIRKVPVRRVQGAGQEDGRAEGSQERTAKQLGCYLREWSMNVSVTSGACCMYISKQQESRRHQIHLSGPIDILDERRWSKKLQL